MTLKDKDFLKIHKQSEVEAAIVSFFVAYVFKGQKPTVEALNAFFKNKPQTLMEQFITTEIVDKEKIFNIITETFEALKKTKKIITHQDEITFYQNLLKETNLEAIINIYEFKMQEVAYKIMFSLNKDKDQNKK